MNKQLISEVERGKKKKAMVFSWKFSFSCSAAFLNPRGTEAARGFSAGELRGCSSSPSLPYLALGWLFCDLDQAGIHVMLKKCKRDFLN